MDLETKLVLETVLKTLNNIPNHNNVGPDGQSSYEIAVILGKFINNKSGQPCTACGTLTTRTKYDTSIYVCIDCSH